MAPRLLVLLQTGTWPCGCEVTNSETDPSLDSRKEKDAAARNSLLGIFECDMLHDLLAKAEQLLNKRLGWLQKWSKTAEGHKETDFFFVERLCVLGGVKPNPAWRKLDGRRPGRPPKASGRRKTTVISRAPLVLHRLREERRWCLQRALKRINFESVKALAAGEELAVAEALLDCGRGVPVSSTSTPMEEVPYEELRRRNIDENVRIELERRSHRSVYRTPHNHRATTLPPTRPSARQTPTAHPTRTRRTITP